MTNPSTPQPGWYPDPSGNPGQLRYYDGARWTEHRAAAAPPVVPPGPPHAPSISASVPYASPVRTTPDGRPLASWGARLGAYLIDGVIMMLISGILLLPLWISLFHGIFDNLDTWQATHGAATTPEDPFELYDGQWGTLAGVAAGTMVLQWVYVLVFWRWKQATIGKLLLGLRIEYRDSHDRLTWGAILQRWLLQYAVGIVYVAGNIFVILDALWPLWDKDSQALHEKWPKTNVVRKR